MNRFTLAVMAWTTAGFLNGCGAEFATGNDASHTAFASPTNSTEPVHGALVARLSTRQGVLSVHSTEQGTRFVLFDHDGTALSGALRADELNTLNPELFQLYYNATARGLYGIDARLDRYDRNDRYQTAELP
jgi:hypothetical protein